MFYRVYKKFVPRLPEDYDKEAKGPVIGFKIWQGPSRVFMNK